MNKNSFYKKALGTIGVSAIMVSSSTIPGRLGLLLPEKERAIFCFDQQKNECLSDHLTSKIGIYTTASNMGSTITMQLSS